HRGHILPHVHGRGHRPIPLHTASEYRDGGHRSCTVVVGVSRGGSLAGSNPLADPAEALFSPLRGFYDFPDSTLVMSAPSRPRARTTEIGSPTRTALASRTTAPFASSVR